jgi:hypothetical protein
MRVAQALLVTDAAVLICGGLFSLFFVPPSLGEPYISSGRLLYGGLPTILGAASLVWAIRLGFGGRAEKPNLMG